MGLKPTTSALGGLRAIHCATGAYDLSLHWSVVVKKTKPLYIIRKEFLSIAMEMELPGTDCRIEDKNNSEGLLIRGLIISLIETNNKS